MTTDPPHLTSRAYTYVHIHAIILESNRGRMLMLNMPSPSHNILRVERKGARSEALREPGPRLLRKSDESTRLGCRYRMRTPTDCWSFCHCHLLCFVDWVASRLGATPGAVIICFCIALWTCHFFWHHAPAPRLPSATSDLAFFSRNHESDLSHPPPHETTEAQTNHAKHPQAQRRAL